MPYAPNNYLIYPIDFKLNFHLNLMLLNLSNNQDFKYFEFYFLLSLKCVNLEFPLSFQ